VAISSDAEFITASAVFVVGLSLIAGAIFYRRGERWSLAALATPPAGVVLGIYATDHHHRWLGLPAFILLVLGPLLRQAIIHRSRRSART
jgi:uncharacterized membrane protein YfcA